MSHILCGDDAHCPNCVEQLKTELTTLREVEKSARQMLNALKEVHEWYESMEGKSFTFQEDAGGSLDRMLLHKAWESPLLALDKLRSK